MYIKLLYVLAFGVMTGAIIHCLIFIFIRQRIMKSFFQRMHDFISEIGKQAEEGSIHDNSIEQRIKKEFQDEIDDFLENRLGMAMPVLAPFLDELFIIELKEVFRNELDNRLPVILSKMTKAFTSDLSLSNEKKLRKLLSSQLRKAMFYFVLAGALNGLIISVLLVFIVPIN